MGDQGTVRKLSVVPQPAAASVPHSVPAEQALLGAVMVDNRLYDELGGQLRPEHFYVPLHAAIFESIERLINVRGREANPINLREELRNTPFDSDGGLFPHLSAMFETAALAGDIKSLSDVIQNAYVQRQMMALADSMKAEAGKASSKDLSAVLIGSVSDELYRLTDAGTTGTLRNIRVSLKEMLEHAEAARQSGSGVTGVATGYPDLDRLIGGLQRSDLIILGARPSMGKTALVLNIAQHAAKALAAGNPNGAAVGVFSLEMSAEQLLQRMVAGAAGINSQHIANGRLSDADFGKLAQASAEIADLPLLIDEAASLSIHALRAKARQMKRKYGIGLLVVDYLQLMSAPTKRGEQNRVQEISEISQGLKQIARDLNIPVLVASQLSRNVENRDNKRPILADLRESGSIEQDADLVAFLYRPEYYISRQLGAGSEGEIGADADRRRVAEASEQLERSKGLAELIIAKNRKGPTDTVKLMFDAANTTFHSHARSTS